MNFHYKVYSIALILFCGIIILCNEHIFAQSDKLSQNRTLVINFDSITVNKDHDENGKDATKHNSKNVAWDMDAFVNDKRIKLSWNTGLYDIHPKELIPLGKSVVIDVSPVKPLTIFTIGFDHDIEETNTPHISPDWIKILDSIQWSFGPENILNVKGGLGFIPNLVFQGYMSLFTQTYQNQTDPIGLIQKVYSSNNNFGIGKHEDCSKANYAIDDVDTYIGTNCDYILRYTISEITDKTSEQPKWHKWKILDKKPILSNPAVISNGDGKYDIVVLGTDQILWHKQYDYNWYENGWEPLNYDTKQKEKYEPEKQGFFPSSIPVSIVSDGPERLHIIAKDQQDKLYHTWYNHIDGGKWNKWDLISNKSFSSGISSFLHNNKVNVFVLDRLNSSCASSFDATTTQKNLDAWISPEKDNLCGLYVNTSKSPSASSYNPPLKNWDKLYPPKKNNLHVSDLNISEICGSSSIHCTIIRDFEKYNISLTSPPIFVETPGSERVDLFALNESDSIWHSWYNKNEIGVWKLNGSDSIDNLDILYPPTIVSTDPNSVNLTIFITTKNNRTLYSIYDGKMWNDNVWDNNWKPLEDTPFPISAISWDNPKQIHIFSRNNTSLIHNWFG